MYKKFTYNIQIQLKIRKKKKKDNPIEKINI